MSVATTEDKDYRPLEPGERAYRKTCPTCGDKHAAVIDLSSWTMQCRACGQVYQPMVRPQSNGRFY